MQCREDLEEVNLPSFWTNEHFSCRANRCAYKQVFVLADVRSLMKDWTYSSRKL